MELLDGYSVISVPESRERGWVLGTQQPAYALSTGEAWTVEEEALKQYVQGRWLSACSSARASG